MQSIKAKTSGISDRAIAAPAIDIGPIGKDHGGNLIARPDQENQPIGLAVQNVDPAGGRIGVLSVAAATNAVANIVSPSTLGRSTGRYHQSR
ncbi:MAG TPA: hypothetical protein VLK27_01870 [Chthoniobacterales bacterium]|nr:hypothetical protein [Chthoniobacterales bacterium]